MIIGGYIMESSKKQALKMIGHNDALMDEAFFKEEGQGKDNATGTTNNAGKKWTPALRPRIRIIDHGWSIFDTEKKLSSKC